MSKEYDRRYPGQTPAERGRGVNERCQIARELFNRLPLDEQRQLQADADAAYELELKQHDALQEALEKETSPPLKAQLVHVSRSWPTRVLDVADSLASAPEEFEATVCYPVST